MTLCGFVDLQVNGYRGLDFSSIDLTESGVECALRGLIADGTAVLLPTLITSSRAVYERNLPLLARVIRRPEFAPHIPGLHLEGPFLSGREGFTGAHDPQWMQAAEPALLDRFQVLSGGLVRLLTIAPEIPGALVLIRHARALGITVSLGHSAADEADISAACDAGATALTHLGNGLPHQINRHRNPLFAGLAEDRLCACVIGDGHHLPWSLLRIILRTKGLSNCALVSDASSLAGLPPGTYPNGDCTTVIDASGKLYNPATGYLAGSAMTMRQVINATRAALGLDDAQIHTLAVTNPLRLIGHTILGGIVELPRADDGSWLAAGALACRYL